MAKRRCAICGLGLTRASDIGYKSSTTGQPICKNCAKREEKKSQEYKKKIEESQEENENNLDS